MRDYSSPITLVNDALTRLAPFQAVDHLMTLPDGAYAGVSAQMVAIWLQRFLSTSIEKPTRL